eukprot:COSAG02_NODE_18817_length_917_cov_0.913203_1_plen_113_part_10
MAKRYACVRRSVIRAGFEMDSEKAGTLEKGTEIEALEERTNAQGIIRVRFDGGWTSLATEAGLVVLEEVLPTEGEAAGANVMQKKTYVCVRRSVIRAGFEMDSDKAGTLEKGT